MVKCIATIFTDLEPVHLTKDVGMFAAALAKEAGNDAESVVYHWGKNAIESRWPTLPCLKTKNIEAHNRAIFLVKSLFDIIRKRIEVVTLYHVTPQTVLMTLALKLLGRRVYIKLDLNKLAAHRLVPLWDRHARPSSLFAKFVVGMADCISCEDFEVYTLLRKYPWVSRRMLSIPNCILRETVPVPPRALSERDNTILFVGRLGAKEKNAEIILKALETMPPGKFTWKLFFCGSTTPEFQLAFDRLIQQRSDLLDRVILAGNLDRVSLFETYSRAKVLLLTSRFEGFSLAALEAAWMGCYLMATPVGGIAQLTDQWRLGKALAHDDIGGLVQALVDLCEDRNAAVNQVQSRVDFVHSNFDIEYAARKIARALNITSANE